MNTQITPMEALAALFAEGQEDAAQQICTSLNQRIFEGPIPAPSSAVRRFLARGVLRLMQATTQSVTDVKGRVTYRNRILERSGHPYALTLLAPSDSASFVAGGDSMNAVYMMLVPEIAKNGNVWDRLLLDSVQGRDVQLRFFWETRLTYECAQRHLEQTGRVRLKAFAAGTGLSMVLVADQLMQAGAKPSSVSIVVSDRDPEHGEKTRALVEKLPRLRDLLDCRGESGLQIVQEDALAATAGDFDVITAVGILEYFPGHTFQTTAERLRLPEAKDAPSATQLLARVVASANPTTQIVLNSYREQAGGRILEVFGKRFYYRGRGELEALAAEAGLQRVSDWHSGSIYDVAVFCRHHK